MKTRLSALVFLFFILICSCKKDANLQDGKATNPEKTETDSKTEALNPAPNYDSNAAGSLSVNTPLQGTAWYSFINVRQPGDLYNYFIRYAEYTFQETQMEFFANMVNAKQIKNYTMRKDSMFFLNGNMESFQFKILERSEDQMTVKAPSSKVNKFLRLSNDDLRLSRKERIKQALIKSNLFDVAEIEEQFVRIDSITIN